jgi:hypothetical protein
MAVDERRRSQRFERLAGAVGEEAAGTMFELLPPPQSDLATTADLERLERKMDHRFELVDQRFAQMGDRFTWLQRELEARIDGTRDELLAAFRGELVTAVAGQTRAMLVAVVTTVAAVGGLALAMTQLLAP